LYFGQDFPNPLVSMLCFACERRLFTENGLPYCVKTILAALAE